MRFKAECCQGEEKENDMKVAMRSKDTLSHFQVLRNEGCERKHGYGSSALQGKQCVSGKQKEENIQEEQDYVGDFAEV